MTLYMRIIGVMAKILRNAIKCHGLAILFIGACRLSINFHKKLEHFLSKVKQFNNFVRKGILFVIYNIV